MRYWRLWLSFFKMSWMADVEYRLNFTARIFGEFTWYATQLSVFEVLYTHTKTINGWDVQSMRVFIGSLFLADILYMIFFSENLEHFFVLVRKGDLDLYLVKPINSQFMVSCRKIAVAYIVNLMIVVAYLIWAMQNLGLSYTLPQIATYVVMVFLGVSTVYSMKFMFSTLSVIFQDASSLQFVWHQLYRLGTRPDPLYPRFLRMIVMTIFPIAFFASVPSRILVEGFNWLALIGSFVFGVGFLWLSNVFWERALRSYSSASS